MQDIVVIIAIAVCLGFVAWYLIRSVKSGRKPGCAGCGACEPEKPQGRPTHFIPADALRRRR